jgi:hypothetical protein
LRQYNTRTQNLEKALKMATTSPEKKQLKDTLFQLYTNPPF